MVSSAWVSAFSGMASTLGLPTATLVYLISFLICLTVAIGFIGVTKKKELALPTLLFMMFFMIIAGALEWVFLIFPLILIGYFYFKRESG